MPNCQNRTATPGEEVVSVCTVHEGDREGTEARPEKNLVDHRVYGARRVDMSRRGD